MITQKSKQEIIDIWDNYFGDDLRVRDKKGVEYDDINAKRTVAIVSLRKIIGDFLGGSINLAEFKTSIDSFNKQNNYWGFTSIKGQMFFNLLLKTSETDVQLASLSNLLKRCIAEPLDLPNALEKIEELEAYAAAIFNNAADKRKAPNPGSTGYFLSYFWQINNPEKWPVMYSSMIVSFADIGIWENLQTQKDAYAAFYNLNNEIKGILTAHAKKEISNWDAEHAFWKFRTITAYPNTIKPVETVVKDVVANNSITVLDEASFDIFNYVPRIVENLIDLGNESEMSGSAKGAKFERSVAEIFRQLGFSVTSMGQGYRDPDLIAIIPEENTAFIVDAKAYANGYALGASDERAIREYINYHCPRLKKEGIQRIAFIIVSNSFKSGFEEFINDITWKTDIKRFILLSSNALLHLLAYKIKDQKTLSEIAETLVGLAPVIGHKDVIQKFDDI